MPTTFYARTCTWPAHITHPHEEAANLPDSGWFVAGYIGGGGPSGAHFWLWEIQALAAQGKGIDKLLMFERATLGATPRLGRQFECPLSASNPVHDAASVLLGLACLFLQIEHGITLTVDTEAQVDQVFTVHEVRKRMPAEKITDLDARINVQDLQRKVNIV